MNKNILRVKFMVLLFMAVVISESISAQVHDKDYYYERANWRVYNGDLAGAIADLNTVIKFTPNDSNVYNARGLIYEKCGDYTAARADFEYALRLNPSSSEAVHNLSNLNNKMQNAGRQVNVTVDSGLRSSNVNAPSQTYQTTRMYTAPITGNSYTSTQRTAAPIQNAAIYQTPSAQSGNNQAISHVPSNSTTYIPATTYSTYNTNSSYPSQSVQTQRSAINYNQNQYVNDGYNYNYSSALPQTPQRTATFTTAAYGRLPAYNVPSQKSFIDPIAETYNSQGMALSGYGRFDEAILQFEAAIKIYPGYAIAFNNRGVAFANKGDLVKASADFDQALRINPYYYDAQINRERLLGRIAQR
ncbi:MAG: tetratricopeptide repeat protein [Treponema sp.]|jgi:tetratricopeptide (TPR) repeat protein|nr:tetratricopeptide repeat protein [Treponema sp.]